MMRQKLNYTYFLSLLLILVPVILFAFYIYNHSLNVPYMDDMELVDTINILKKDPSRFFSILVRQQNDHRSGFARLGIILSCFISGQMNFRLTIMLGYLNLLFLGYTFFLVYKSANRRISAFLPVTFLLFSPIVYQVHLWSLTAFQHTLSIAFSICCLYFLQPEKRSRWFLAIPFVIAAGLTNLDGITVIPVALFWLLIQGRRSEFSIFLGFSVLYLILYFTGFKFSPASKIEFSFSSIPLIVQSFVAATGSLAKIISDTHSVFLSLLFGSVIIPLFVFFKIFPEKTKFSSGVIFKNMLHFDFTDIGFLRLLVSMATIAAGRYADGVESMMGIRFQIYSVSVVILLYLFLLKNLEMNGLKIFKAVAFALSMIVCAYTYKKYEAAVHYYSAGLKADSFNYPNNGIFLHQYFNLPDPDAEFYAHYKFPAYFNEKTIDAWKYQNTRTDTAKLNISRLPNESQYKNYLKNLIQFQIANLSADVPEKGVYLGLRNNAVKGKFYIVALFSKGSFIKRFFNRSQPKNYLGEMPAKLPSGTYTAILCWTKDGRPATKLLSSNTVL